jgi:hypothetical protein
MTKRLYFNGSVNGFTGALRLGQDAVVERLISPDGMPIGSLTAITNSDPEDQTFIARVTGGDAFLA